ncbi:hypothetical protein TrLO_g5739 [Triparma laevis f. longispina]|uniref:Uncharacterized protein n=1 Tax=Triparma laevis f. longispina TaxID=1714387 RepID=A0A9W7AQJ1_9STRA|nr:hypothetical protein TrLO_g5739 [Triparma laevis f. longispina]
MGILTLLANNICNFLLVATTTCALVSCLSPFYSYEATNTDGTYGGSVGLFTAVGSPMFCYESNIFFPSTGTRLSFSSTLGECNNTEADVCRAFAIVAVACSGLALFFNAVMDESIHPKVTSLIAFTLSVITCGASLVVILTYVIYLKNWGNLFGVCDAATTTFTSCSEYLEWGFWFQIGTCIGALASAVCLVGKTIFVQSDDAATWRNVITKTLRFAEFTVILIATFGAYDKLSPVIYSALTAQFGSPNNNGFGSTSIYTTLWDGAYCTSDGFYSYYKPDSSANSTPPTTATYGDCTDPTIAIVQIFVVVCLGLSAFNCIGRDNARKSKYRAYVLLMGLFFELCTLGLVTAAATIYQVYIFPPRLGNTNFCSSMNAFWVAFSTAETSAGCTQTMSYGIILLFVAIFVTFASAVSVIIAPDNEKISLRAALKTIKEGPEEEEEEEEEKEVEEVPPPPPSPAPEEAESDHAPEDYEDLDISIIRSDTGEEEDVAKFESLDP